MKFFTRPGCSKSLPSLGVTVALMTAAVGAHLVPDEHLWVAYVLSAPTLAHTVGSSCLSYQSTASLCI